MCKVFVPEQLEHGSRGNRRTQALREVGEGSMIMRLWDISSVADSGLVGLVRMSRKVEGSVVEIAVRISSS